MWCNNFIVRMRVLHNPNLILRIEIIYECLRFIPKFQTLILGIAYVKETDDNSLAEGTEIMFVWDSIHSVIYKAMVERYQKRD